MFSLELLTKIFYSLLAVVMIAGAFLGLVLASRRFLSVQLDRKHTIRLENRGNCRSQYYIQVSSPEPQLSFSLMIGKVPLAEVREPEQEAEMPLQEEPLAQTDPEPATVKGSNPQPGAAASNAGKTAKAAAAKAGTLASLLGALGQILPGSLGAGLRARSAQARDMQVGTNRALQAPKTLQNQANAIKNDSSKLAGKKPSKTQFAASRQGVGPRKLTVASKGTSAASPSERKDVPGDILYESPELDAGKSFDVTLKIGAKTKRYPSGSFAYTINSEQVALDFPEISSESVSRSGVVHFPAVSGWRYWLPSLAIVLLVLLSFISLAYVYLLIWQ
jgi:hypothetical protein